MTRPAPRPFALSAALFVAACAPAPPPTVPTAPATPPSVPAVQAPAAVSGPRWVVRTFDVKSPRDPDCRVTVRSFAVSGLADAALEARINAAVAPEAIALQTGHVAQPGSKSTDATCNETPSTCDATEAGLLVMCRTFDGSRGGLYHNAELRPTLLDDKLLSIRHEYDFDGGGAHPSDGVTGVTIDLRTGRLLDARDLLAQPTQEPDWISLLPDGYVKKIVETSGEANAMDIVSFGIGTLEGGRELAAPLPFREFYVTREGLALIPIVPEVARVFRHDVPTIPWARVRGALRADGPAAHLYR